MTIYDVLAIICGAIGTALLILSAVPPLVLGVSVNFTKAIIAILLMSCALLLKMYSLSQQQKIFIEVERVDDNKYIQCINNTKMLIISANSSRASDTSTMLLGSDGKPIPCNIVKYTESEIDLPQNKSKTFVSIAE